MTTEYLLRAQKREADKLDRERAKRPIARPSRSDCSVPRFKMVCAMGQNWVQDTGDGNRMIAMCTRYQDAMTIVDAMNRDAQNKPHETEAAPGRR